MTCQEALFWLLVRKQSCLLSKNKLKLYYTSILYRHNLSWRFISVLLFPWQLILVCNIRDKDFCLSDDLRLAKCHFFCTIQISGKKCVHQKIRNFWHYQICNKVGQMTNCKKKNAIKICKFTYKSAKKNFNRFFSEFLHKRSQMMTTN